MTATFLCVMTVVEGIALLIVDFLSFVYRKITVGFMLCWGAFSIVFILLGAVPGLSDWTKIVPLEAVPAYMLISLSIMGCFFYLSCAVSELLRKNQELAMHVSLLNQENEIILEKLHIVKTEKAGKPEAQDKQGAKETPEKETKPQAQEQEENPGKEGRPQAQKKEEKQGKEKGQEKQETEGMSERQGKEGRPQSQKKEEKQGKEEISEKQGKEGKPQSQKKDEKAGKREKAKKSGKDAGHGGEKGKNKNEA